MFIALMIVCNIEGGCVQLADIRGPYLTEELCLNRIEEFVEDFSTSGITKDWYFHSGECTFDKSPPGSSPLQSTYKLRTVHDHAH